MNTSDFPPRGQKRITPGLLSAAGGDCATSVEDDFVRTATSKPEPAIARATKHLGRITPRAIILAIILTIINDYWIVQLEVVRYSFPTYAAPFYNVIFTLLLLTTLNLALRKRWPQHALTRVEMITVYVMLSISAGVCSHEMMAILVGMMGHATFFKTEANQWGPMFEEKLPNWLVVKDPTSLHNFYYGNSSILRYENYGPWIVPVICWSAFAAVLLWTMLCLNSILRKQWVENERLTFPIVTLPLEMTHESGELFRNKQMWIGFAISGALTLIAGLNFLWPSVPYLRIVRQNVGQYITQPPWNAMGAISVAFYFWAIGIAYIMPLELSASCWIFYWINKFELVFCRAMGYSDLAVPGGGFDNTYPFAISQTYGAYIGFFVISMWSSRHYLARVFRTAFLGTREEDESREPVSYKTAILGAVFGFLFLCGFARAMGMSPALVPVVFILYFIVVVLVSRIRAELGFPTHDAYIMGAHKPVVTVVGTEHLSQADLSGFGLFMWINRDWSSSPSPHMIESFKLAEQCGCTQRQMFKAALIAGIIAMPIGFFMLLQAYYHYGGATARMESWATGFGRDCWGHVEKWIKSPVTANGTSLSFVGVGFLISIALGWIRLRVLNFPLHPLAYAMSTSWGVGQLWLPLLIGSTAKFITLKMGGLKGYRTALPFFLGLILGEIAIGSLWTILGIILGIPTYDFWPGKYEQGGRM